MTISEFLKRLEKTPRRWRLVNGSISRHDLRLSTSRGEACPITSVAPGSPPAYQWSLAALGLGLSYEDADLIIEAADWRKGSAEQQKLRQQLFAACGVREVSRG